MAIHHCKTTGKVVYSKNGAEGARQACYKQRSVRLRIYQCPEGCGGWHLTSLQPFKGVHDKNKYRKHR